MADITFTIPDEHMSRFVDGMAAHFGYSDTLPDGTDNPETKGQYIRSKVRLEWKNRVLKQERQIIESTPIDIE